MGTNVELVSITPNAEPLLVKMARVSSSNPDNPDYVGLVRYLIKHQHWSPFQMVHMTVSIVTSRAIAAQLLRHASFAYQELSQRYTSDIDKPTLVEGRRQSDKNRQSSTDPLSELGQDRWLELQTGVYKACYNAYNTALAYGVAREQARLLLPLATPTHLYMCGSVRSWVHYLALRTKPDTQQEHREIAEAIKAIFIEQMPVTSQALGWAE